VTFRGRTWLSRTYAGRHRRALNRVLPFVFYITPLFVIFGVVVGSIFLKLAAPTEAAALGCIASAAVCYFFRLFKNTITLSGIDGADFGWREIWKALMETAKVNTMILFIITGSLVFSQALAASGATNGLLQQLMALDLTVLVAMVLMMLVLLFLGAFMDQVSMLLLTLPFFLPLAGTLGIDVLWLMVLMLIVMEISLLTPPFGLLLYVMKGVAPFEVGLAEIVRSALPFILIELLVLAILILLPEVAIWLPKQID
jgi:TRAP-type C4-dicarboxylate transport system permease large subunit